MSALLSPRYGNSEGSRKTETITRREQIQLSRRRRGDGKTEVCYGNFLLFILKKFPSHIQSRTRGGRLRSGEQSHSWMRRFVMSRLHPCLTFLVSRAAPRRRRAAPPRRCENKKNKKPKQRFKSASLAGEPNHPSESRLHSTLTEKLNRKKKTGTWREFQRK